MSATTMTLALAGAGAVALGMLHVVTPVLSRLPARYQAWLANLSGGAGLAYVTLYLLYELTTEGAAQLHAVLPVGPAPLESLFIVLLAALASTYVLQVQLQKTLDLHDDHHGYAALFLVYNVLVGTGLPEEARWGVTNVTFYVLALGLHMVFNDLFLHHICPGAHTRVWRIGLAVGPMLGCGLVAMVAVPAGYLYMLLTLIAGGTIINVLRFELPGAPGFRPIAFLCGLVVYAALILATWRF